MKLHSSSSDADLLCSCGVGKKVEHAHRMQLEVLRHAGSNRPSVEHRNCQLVFEFHGSVWIY